MLAEIRLKCGDRDGQVLGDTVTGLPLPELSARRDERRHGEHRDERDEQKISAIPDGFGRTGRGRPGRNAGDIGRKFSAGGVHLGKRFGRGNHGRKEGRPGSVRAGKKRRK